MADDNGGFNALGLERRCMQCHYCDRDADIGVEKDGITVGVCEPHFREQLDELEESEWLEGIDEQLDVDRTE